MADESSGATSETPANVSDGEIETGATDVWTAAGDAVERARERSGTVNGGVVAELDEAVLQQVYDQILAARVPSPESFDSMIEALRLAYNSSDGIRSGDVGAVSGLSRRIGDGQGSWSGDAAYNFNRYYAEPFDNCRDNQIGVLGELETILLSAKDLVIRRRSDAVQTAKKTVEALDACGGCSMADTTVTLSVMGAALTVAGVAVTTGGSAAIVAAAVSATPGVLSTGISAIDYAIKGKDYNDVLSDALVPLEASEQAMSDMAEDLATRLSDFTDAIGETVFRDLSSEAVPDLVPHEPNVEGGPPRVTDGDGAALDGEFNAPS